MESDTTVGRPLDLQTGIERHCCKSDIRTVCKPNLKFAGMEIGEIPVASLCASAAQPRVADPNTFSNPLFCLCVEPSFELKTDPFSGHMIQG